MIPVWGGGGKGCSTPGRESDEETQREVRRTSGPENIFHLFENSLDMRQRFLMLGKETYMRQESGKYVFVLTNALCA